MTDTRGIRVEVDPVYLPEQSDPEGAATKGPVFVFGYTIRITNLGDEPVRLLTRFWRIVDADGEERIVEGQGVVGEQPEIEPGRYHEYSSFCPIETPWGTMEGRYGMRVESGSRERFDVAVGRFFLVAD